MPSLRTVQYSTIVMYDYFHNTIWHEKFHGYSIAISVEMSLGIRLLMVNELHLMTAPKRREPQGSVGNLAPKHSFLLQAKIAPRSFSASRFSITFPVPRLWFFYFALRCSGFLCHCLGWFSLPYIVRPGQGQDGEARRGWQRSILRDPILNN